MTPPRTIKSFLEELATYVSLLAPLLGALIAWWGLSQTRYTFLFYASLPLALGGVWLVSQYRLARARIDKEGVVQRPTWFWRLITNKVPHKSEQLTDSQVMVFVPPAKEPYASRLREEYNQGLSHILLFHYIPHPVDGVINEDEGRVAVDGEIRSLEILAQEINECAALVLLDDAKWRTYKRTMHLVEEWTKRHTVRPVMSVHLDGRGTLNYSWNRIEDLIGNNRSLKNRLLAQSANRGAKWFWQARLNRRIVFWTLALSLIFSLTTIIISYKEQSNAKAAEADALGKYDSLKADSDTLRKVVSSYPSSQQKISRAFERYRSAQDEPESRSFQLLLQVHADEILRTLAAASNRIEAIYGNVMMFSTIRAPDAKDKTRNLWRIREVAATRTPPNLKEFGAVDQPPSGKTVDIDGIVTCAIVSHAFILWSGQQVGNQAVTSNIEAWTLEGQPVGSFHDGKIDIDDYRCSYQVRSVEDLHKSMLCAPVGLDLNSNKTTPAGAICISYPQDEPFLKEAWVHQTIARYGNSLSFESWDRALARNPEKTSSSPSKSTRSTRVRRPLRRIRGR